MKLHSLQIIPGVSFPHSAIVDVMLQPDPDVQMFRHVRSDLMAFIDYHKASGNPSVLLSLLEWAEGLQSRVADAA